MAAAVARVALHILVLVDIVEAAEDVSVLSLMVDPHLVERVGR